MEGRGALGTSQTHVPSSEPGMQPGGAAWCSLCAGVWGNRGGSSLRGSESQEPVPAHEVFTGLFHEL